ncbi:unnamed protein product [Choristocarpus tenellus]
MDVSRSSEVVFWYSLPKSKDGTGSSRSKKSQSPSPFKHLADYFGLWHEYLRTMHNGVHTMRLDGNIHLMLINAASSPYAELKPPNVIPAELKPLDRSSMKNVALLQKSRTLGMQMRPAGESLQSCDLVCQAEGLACTEEMMVLVNSCNHLKKFFPCTVCEQSVGSEQPCYVIPEAPVSNFPDRCLVTSEVVKSTCAASHALTKRLCPCIHSLP